jgi:HAD superfamily hydrolase (TIGR01509 family)
MQALIFDFGNVVGFFDHQKTLARLTPHTDMSGAEMFHSIYQGQLEDDFEAGRIGAHEFLALFQKSCRLKCDQAFLQTAIADIFEPNPEVCSLIPRLKTRYRILLGSNTNPVHSLHFRRQFAEVLGSFHAVVLSHEIGVRKPKAGFFEHCQQLAGCPASECLFIDDLAPNIEGARAVGLQGLLYKPGQDLARQLREFDILI